MLVGWLPNTNSKWHPILFQLMFCRWHNLHCIKQKKRISIKNKKFEWLIIFYKAQNEIKKIFFFYISNNPNIYLWIKKGFHNYFFLNWLNLMYWIYFMIFIIFDVDYKKNFFSYAFWSGEKSYFFPSMEGLQSYAKQIAMLIKIKKKIFIFFFVF